MNNFNKNQIKIVDYLSFHDERINKKNESNVETIFKTLRQRYLK